MFRTRLSRRRVLAAIAATSFVLRGHVRAQEPVQPALTPLPEVADRPEGALDVIATTPILADIARQVGGARVNVQSLLPINADAHDFEPAPEDIVRLEEATLVIEHGLKLDPWATSLIETAGAEHVLVATAGVSLLTTDDDEFSDGDPHVWFDPANVKVMAANVAASLTDLDPNGASDYAARRDAYAAQLDALDAWIAAQIATIPPERRKLVTNHDAFAYYVNKYGLVFVGSVIPSIDSRAEPSAKEIADLIERIQAEGVPAIFTESTINPELEHELADQAGVTVSPNLYSDNLGDAESGADTYIGMMIANTTIIVAALSAP